MCLRTTTLQISTWKEDAEQFVLARDDVNVHTVKKSSDQDPYSKLWKCLKRYCNIKLQILFRPVLEAACDTGAQRPELENFKT